VASRNDQKLLKELAQLHGVDPGYRSVITRRWEPASPEALLAVLRALGVPVAGFTDLPSALREARGQLWRRVVEPVVVAWGGPSSAGGGLGTRKGCEIEIRIPARKSRSVIACELRLETGEERNWTVRAARLRTSARALMEGTRFVAKQLPLPGPLPLGYHRLTVTIGAESFSTLLISAPAQAYAPDPARRPWGVFLPLHALRSRQSLGIGDFADLEALRDWLEERGGSVIGTLPLLATFLDEPFQPSPYSPVSRMFWNELYLDVRRVPELASSPAARAALESAELRAECEALLRAPLVDYRRAARLKRPILEELARSLTGGPSSRQDAFHAYLETHPILQDYARFRAAGEKLRASWWVWPQPMRDGVLREGDYDPQAEHYHRYVQWLAHEQLSEIAGKNGEPGPSVRFLDPGGVHRTPETGVPLRKGSPEVSGPTSRHAGIYLDFPLGVSSDGYDVWRERSSYSLEASAGAPPDEFFTRGQNWGFPPLHPQRIREQGYAYFIACMRNHLRHAAILRLDHVMGLHRLYWVPRGFPAHDGAYVRYPAEEQYAILALESHRNHAIIVGEDLGTVPREVRPKMARHRFQRMYVLQFEAKPEPKRALPAAPAETLSCVNTHDMATFVTFWEGGDIGERVAMGLLDAEGARVERATRDRIRKALVTFFRRRGLLNKSAGPSQVLRAGLKWLGASPTRILVANLEDFWLEPEPQNIPGTGPERPNWRRKARYALEEFRALPQLLEALRQLNRSRRSHAPYGAWRRGEE